MDCIILSIKLIKFSAVLKKIKEIYFQLIHEVKDSSETKAMVGFEPWGPIHFMSYKMFEFKMENTLKKSTCTHTT